MRVSATVFWCVAFLGGITHANSTLSSSQSLDSIQASIPTCAKHCSAPSISGLTCTPTTVAELAACLCPNPVARGKIAACVVESCTSLEAYLASRPARVYCVGYPIESKSREVKTAAIVLLAVTLPFVAGRAWSRIAILKALWWDDYTLALAATIQTANLILNFPLSDKGLGKHSWDIDPLEAVPLAKLFYSAQICYTLVQFITKFSILLCFLRIFPQRWFRYTIFGTLTFVALKGIIFLFTVIFRCVPIASLWNRDLHPTCLKLDILTYVAAGFSIVEDLWILGLPIPVLKSLKMNMENKLVLVGMFSVGSLACITSIVRLKYIKGFGHSQDPTWDNVKISIWSILENSVAVICACLPALRPLFSRVLPNVFNSLPGRTTYATPNLTIPAGEQRLVDDFESAGKMGSTKGSGNGKAIYRGEVDMEGTADCRGPSSSTSSIYGIKAESQEGIRMDIVVSIDVSDVMMPEKSYIRGGDRINYGA